MIEISASDFCDSVRDGTHDSPKPVEGHGRPLITTKHMKGGRVSIEDAYLISEADFEKVNQRSQVHQWDVLISMIGTLGELVLVQDEPTYAIKNIGLFKTKSKYDGLWLYYYLQSPKAKNYMLTSAQGSTQQYLSLKTLRSFPLLVPDSEPNKRAICEILKSIDDKIELNQKMNQTLEEIAKTIFNSWFVDFDPVRAKAESRPTGLPPEISDLFPDQLVNSDIGKIPKGWEIKSVGEICEKIAMGPFGSNIKVSTFVDDGIPIISGHHLHNFLLKEGDHKFITEEHAKSLKNSLVRSGDVIFTHAGTLGQVSLVPKDSDYGMYVISQRQFYARPLKNEYSAYLNFFFHTPIGQHKLLSNVSGSGVPSIARPSSHLKTIELTLADEHLVHKFDQLVSPMIERMVLISREVHSLSELRDTLLPKLISGEVRIPDAEKFLEQAGI